MRREARHHRGRSGPRLGGAILCLAALAFDVTAVAAHAALLDANRVDVPALALEAADHRHSAPVHDTANCPICRDRVQPRAALVPAPATDPAAPLPVLGPRETAPFVSWSTGVRSTLGARAPPALS